MDEIAAKRFDRSANDPSADTVPSVNEVLNAALKEAADKGLTEVIVILHDAENSRTVLMNNVWELVRVIGMLNVAVHNHMRLTQ